MLYNFSYIFLINLRELINVAKVELDPSTSFKFGIEDRILCSSGKVTYNTQHDYIVSLNIPLHEATNKGEYLCEWPFLMWELKCLWDSKSNTCFVLRNIRRITILSQTETRETCRSECGCGLSYNFFYKMNLAWYLLFVCRCESLLLVHIICAQLYRLNYLQ